MTEKRFIGSYAGVYDKYKDNRLLWSEWEEITIILNNLNEKSVERSKALSKLQKENGKLKKENKFLRCKIESDSQDDYIYYLKKQNEKLKERITELEKENENQNNILEDFMLMLNRLQAEPNNKLLRIMARDMLRLMGKNIMSDSDD